MQLILVQGLQSSAVQSAHAVSLWFFLLFFALAELLGHANHSLQSEHGNAMKLGPSWRKHSRSAYDAGFPTTMQRPNQGQVYFTHCS